MHLVAGSDLIDKGETSGCRSRATAPDLGAFEFGAPTTTGTGGATGTRRRRRPGWHEGQRPERRWRAGTGGGAVRPRDAGAPRARARAARGTRRHDGQRGAARRGRGGGSAGTTGSAGTSGSAGTTGSAGRRVAPERAAAPGRAAAQARRARRHDGHRWNRRDRDRGHRGHRTGGTGGSIDPGEGGCACSTANDRASALGVCARAAGGGQRASARTRGDLAAAQRAPACVSARRAAGHPWPAAGPAANHRSIKSAGGHSPHLGRGLSRAGWHLIER